MNQSDWGDEMAEGVYVKVSDGRVTRERFKMVREDFKPREDFVKAPLERNKLAKGDT